MELVFNTLSSLAVLQRLAVSNLPSLCSRLALVPGSIGNPSGSLDILPLPLAKSAVEVSQRRRQVVHVCRCNRRPASLRLCVRLLKPSGPAVCCHLTATHLPYPDLSLRWS